ncbi:Small integral membrane protein 4 [Armadillidium nasatum]|uniref:Small integral membrane protein 4 n=1 Tax=Armadillidium nasatum TaxID=96803 RepID=A0A5N5TFN7_9CRUS|nr:Small integral membrane protein 4 [Armadillidium nasatum]
MKKHSNGVIRHFLNIWPGKKYFGHYRFLPIFFFGGAAIEFAMIHWHVGEVNFYNTYKRRLAEDLARSKTDETA